MLLCDLDHFKRINDALGHQTGDQSLIAFSQLLTQTLNSKNVFARIDGEEFACLLAAADERAVMRVGEQIRQTFAHLPLLEPGLLSVSIGVVDSTTVGYELPCLLSQANAALYGAKHRGRNQMRSASSAAALAQFG